jgi:hypothetical protein
LALLTIATSVVAVAGRTAAATAAADGGIERLVAAAASVADDVPGAETLRHRCGADVVCAARIVAEVFEGRAVFQRVDHPDTDTIRWAKTQPSVRNLGRLPDGALAVALDRFGRKAARELRAAVAGFGGGRLVLDLRANRGGDFERMLVVAGLFTGPVAEALYVEGKNGPQPRAIPAAETLGNIAGLTLIVGRETASSGEILAALLRRYADAEILGDRTYGKDHLIRAIPVSHDLQLAVPAGRVRVPGESLAGGLAPNRPIPPAMTAAFRH